MHANSNANALSKAMNTQEIRNVLAGMNRLKGQLIRVSNTDPLGKTKRYNTSRRLENLRLKLRRLHDKAYRNFISKKH